MRELKERILEAVRADLEGIEAAIRDNLKPHLDLVRQVAGHILFSGGKRFRPLLMVLSARLCGYRGTYDKTFSTIFEYLHAATLLHDDLVDGASLRRGKPAAHRRWGNETAVLVGDFLLARGLTIAAATGRSRVIEIIAGITEEMSQGEIHQLQRKGALDMSEAEYLEIIRRKTAVLFEGACRISAILSDAPAEMETALAVYGFNLGIAFQMMDDLLDYTAETPELGKRTGADLREGKLTLPVIHALGRASPADRERMAAVLREDFSDDQFRALVRILEGSGGIDYTRSQAGRRIEAAKEALSVFEPSEARRILFDIADYTLTRRV